MASRIVHVHEISMEWRADVTGNKSQNWKCPKKRGLTGLHTVLTVCQWCRDTPLVNFTQNAFSKHGAKFLPANNCNPWWWWACLVAGHYANINHGWLATRPCVCPCVRVRPSVPWLQISPKLYWFRRPFVCFNWINFSEAELVSGAALGRYTAISSTREPFNGVDSGLT